MTTLSGAVSNVEAIVSLLRIIISVTVKVVDSNSAPEQQRLIKEACLIAFHLLSRPHIFLYCLTVFLYFLGSPLLSLLLLLLCHRCILLGHCLLQRIYRDGVRIQSLTEFFRLQDVSYHTTGHKTCKVRVTGYLMWDDDHNGSADVGSTVQWFSKNGFHHPWRSTAWELHPVVKLEVIP
jgi:hypothetical protein